MPYNKAEQLRQYITNVFKRDDITMALSTGTPSPFKKITAMIMDSEGKVLGYAKIGETELAIERIKNEATILKELGLRDKDYELSGKDYGLRIMVPECLYEGELGNAYILIQSPSPFEGKSGSSEFNEDYAEVLSELIKNTDIKKKFTESAFYKQLKNDIEHYPLSFKELLQDGLKHLEKDLGDKEITFGLSHGDFAPWNMVWNKNKKEVFLYDWESASLEAPAGIDLVHFFFQTGFLLKKLRKEHLLHFCIDDKPYNLLTEKIKEPMLDKKALFLSYLLKMAIEEDKPQQLSPSAVERRKLIKAIIHNL